jgi:hypothetical protein
MAWTLSMQSLDRVLNVAELANPAVLGVITRHMVHVVNDVWPRQDLHSPPRSSVDKSTPTRYCNNNNMVESIPLYVVDGIATIWDAQGESWPGCWRGHTPRRPPPASAHTLHS